MRDWPVSFCKSNHYMLSVNVHYTNTTNWSTTWGTFRMIKVALEISSWSKFTCLWRNTNWTPTNREQNSRLSVFDNKCWCQKCYDYCKLRKNYVYIRGSVAFKKKQQFGGITNTDMFIVWRYLASINEFYIFDKTTPQLLTDPTPFNPLTMNTNKYCRGLLVLQYKTAVSVLAHKYYGHCYSIVP